MKADTRREHILTAILDAPGPLTATTLAKKFKVSRQIIVGDVAILRAAGHEIYSTPKGYEKPHAKGEGVLKVFACCHLLEQTEAELSAMIYHGAEVCDVIVSHPVYGQISAPLSLKTQYDISAFLQSVARKEAALLSDLTGGVHLHTVRCPSEEAYARIHEKLQQLGVLYTGEA